MNGAGREQGLCWDVNRIKLGAINQTEGA